MACQRLRRRKVWSWQPVLLLLAGVASPLPGQLLVRAPGGIVSGTVQDSVTGRPVGYALLTVLDPDQRVFANEAGRFALSGLRAGALTLRVQQIGYRAITLQLRVQTEAAGASRPELVVYLERQPLVLPEILVEGDVCGANAPPPTGNLEQGLVSEVFKNAERLVALQRDYPFRETYQEIISQVDSANLLIGGRVDTNRYDSRNLRRYRKGRVTERDRFGQESAYYFQPSDLAETEFRNTHCFWYSGRDSLDGLPAFRVQFAPLKRVKSVDWSGSLLIDSATMVLLQSEAHLVNLTPKASTFQSASCSLLYHQVFPTLVSPYRARCVSRHNLKRPFTTYGGWRLIDFKFLRKTPIEPRDKGLGARG